MPGFSRSEKNLVAAMVLGQRRKLHPERIAALVGAHTDEAIGLCIILRLASRLNRTRSPNPRPDIGIAVDGAAIHLTFPPDWLAARPLTLADLELEAQSLSMIEHSLSWV
jgi:exopolyphosphatase/guanosine-5'-triphosphate,3'-diphosphate pyrophosphatase